MSPVVIAENGRRVPVREQSYDLDTIKNALIPDLSQYDPSSLFVSDKKLWNSSSVEQLKNYIQRESSYSSEFNLSYLSDEVKEAFENANLSDRYTYEIVRNRGLVIYGLNQNLYRTKSLVEEYEEDGVKLFRFANAASYNYGDYGTIFWKNPEMSEKAELFTEDSFNVNETGSESNHFFMLDPLLPTKRFAVSMIPKKEIIQSIVESGTLTFPIKIRLKDETLSRSSLVKHPVSLINGVPYFDQNGAESTIDFSVLMTVNYNTVTGVATNSFKFTHACPKHRDTYCRHLAYVEELLMQFGQKLMPVPTALKNPVNQIDNSRSSVPRSRGVNVNDIYVPVKFTRMDGFTVQEKDNGTSFVEFVSSNLTAYHHNAIPNVYQVRENDIFSISDSKIPEALLDFNENSSFVEKLDKIHRLMRFNKFKLMVSSPLIHVKELIERNVPVMVQVKFEDCHYRTHISANIDSSDLANAKITVHKVGNDYEFIINSGLSNVLEKLSVLLDDNFNYVHTIFMNSVKLMFRLDIEEIPFSDFILVNENYSFLASVFEEDDLHLAEAIAKRLPMFDNVNNYSEEKISQLIQEQTERLEHESREAIQEKERYMSHYVADARQLSRNFRHWKEENLDDFNKIINFSDERILSWADKDSPLSEDKDELFNRYIHWNSVNSNEDNANLLPFKKSTVLGNMSNVNEAGRLRFGIEIEFDVDNESNKDSVCRAIGNALYEARLTSHREKGRYHAAARSGWQEWSLEHDSTVAGEVVSPIMVDTPETWAEIEQVLQIIKDNGGIASVRTGCHVNVSSSLLGISTAKRAELLRLTYHYRDVIYRLASNPYTGQHRGTKWCNLISDSNSTHIDSVVENGLHGLEGEHSNHSVGLNMRAVGSNLNKSRVEFRFWDGTLDASIIQRQVMVSVALLDAANNNVNKNTGAIKRSKTGLSLGSGAFKNYLKMKNDSMIEPSQDLFMSDTDHFVSFLDEIFRDNESKLYVSDLFFNTKWQSNEIHQGSNIRF